MLDDVPVTDIRDSPFSTSSETDQLPQLTRRSVTLSIAIVTTSLLVAVAMLLAVPYAVTSPGPTIDTLGSTDGVDLIQINGAPTYPSSGEIRLTTVSMQGGSGREVSLFTMLFGWADPTRVVLPEEELVPTDQTEEEIDASNQAAMVTSQETATVTALEELGYEVPTTLEVEGTIEGTGAVDIAQPGDVVVALNGEDVVGLSDLGDRLDGVTPGDVEVITVERGGERVDLQITTSDDGTGRAILGVWINPTFHPPIDVKIMIDNIGGPSAGTMFALGIIQKLTEPDETGGERIAGTGTIDLDGVVGPIGGIAQKMVGARDDGATWFLAPADNCGEVVGAEPDGLRVVAVSTLHEARGVVEHIGSGDTADLRSCADVLAGD
jgi:Lon-like protease